MMRTTTGSQLGGLGSSDFSLPLRRETLFLDREPQRESLLTSHGLSLYGRDPGLATTRSPALVPRTGGPIVTQVTTLISSFSLFYSQRNSLIHFCDFGVNNYEWFF